MLNTPTLTGAKNKEIRLAGKIALFSFFAVFALINPSLTNAQVVNDDKDQKSEVKTDTKNDEKVEVKSAKEVAKELKTIKDIKTITDRINKNKDEYIVQIRTKFLNNADSLNTISNKIETRINKIEISGEDVSSMNAKLDEANKNIKSAKTLLKALPAKKALLDYTEAKKYASTIIEARNNLETAKEILSDIISNLKDLVIDKDDDKNQ